MEKYRRNERVMDPYVLPQTYWPVSVWIRILGNMKNSFHNRFVAIKTVLSLSVSSAARHTACYFATGLVCIHRED